LDRLFDKLDAVLKEAPDLTREILYAAGRAANEAEFRRPVVNLLERIAAKHELKSEVREERFIFDTGRTDANFSRLTIEFKSPGILNKELSVGETGRAVEKVERYLDGFYRELCRLATPPDKSQLAGIILDGRLIVFVRHVKHAGWMPEPPEEVTQASVERLLRVLAGSAYGKAISPENLIKDFGGGSAHAKRLGGVFYGLVQKDQDSLAGCIFNQWRTFFSETCNYEEGSAKLKKKKELKKFCADMGVSYKGVDVERLIFAVHTYYAFLIKLIAYAVIVSKKTNGGNPLSEVPIMTTVELHSHLKDLEAGERFTSYWGIRNFPEDPYFTWYLHVWNDDLADAVRRLADTLREYDPATFRVKPEGARDLLKKLYQYLVPRDIRHDLGEYYTPDWLAELTLDRLGYEGKAREKLLDPACGSGTFLVLAVQRKIRYCQETERISDETLMHTILESVKGIDLNPLAVTAARANYIFSIDKLLHYYPRGREIPIYLADSIYPPHSSKDINEPNVRPFRTVVGDFKFPIAVSSEAGMSWLAQFLHDHIEKEHGFESFIERLKRSKRYVDEALFDSTGEVAPENVEVFRKVYDDLNKLKTQERNSIWATIIKNAYMPLFLKGFDYVAGNPPWVNWESLPDGYRRETMHLWEDCGLWRLVKKGGMETILGKSKRDLSTLMLYESMRRYLKDGGKLGFVITQSVFKTGAAQGFRHFRILTDHRSKEIPVRAESADDFTDFQPFEGATNRTAMIVVRKGMPTTFPMKHYTVWQKFPGKSYRPDLSLEEMKDITRRLPYHAKPVDAKDKTSAWITAREKALEALKKVLGKSDYQAREGVNSGGANAVYWLKDVELVGKDPHTGKELVRALNLTEGEKSGIRQIHEPFLLEEELVFPLLRGRDVQRWRAKPSAWILMAQDPKTRRGIEPNKMQREYPQAWSYLKRFEKELRDRQSRGIKDMIEKGAPFYTMFAVGEYTFAKHRVVWQRIASSLDGTVLAVEKKPSLPQETHSLVVTDSKNEAHYFAAIFNSSPLNVAAQTYAQRGGKSFASPHILQNVRISKFNPRKLLHRQLAELSEKARKLAEDEQWQELAEVEEKIDLLVAKLYGISNEELTEIKKNLRELSKEDLKTGRLFTR